MTETTPPPPLNRNAIIGFIAAILALLALCAGDFAHSIDQR